MSIKNNKKLIFGVVSAVAGVVAGVCFKNNMNKKAKNFTEEDTNNKKEKKSKNVYYTVHLNDIYNPYDDKTVSENDMIKEIKRETSL
ncbi:hypothetical protein [uncultured Clostridium sp.]|uniref:hypothetical protein n=1 Tax=uncultured Clostridium sp. TaxID=59620 RepID=UPI002625CDAA|nr:hypothetical protein [uncultured Clostridium sp.]